jgi:hypothetical protein
MSTMLGGVRRKFAGLDYRIINKKKSSLAQRNGILMAVLNASRSGAVAIRRRSVEAVSMLKYVGI